jgi:hypothetical protein
MMKASPKASKKGVMKPFDVKPFCPTLTPKKASTRARCSTSEAFEAFEAFVGKPLLTKRSRSSKRLHNRSE